nr:MAG TPA_asm: hypothetical protein [Caudoviricetes sp.]
MSFTYSYPIRNFVLQHKNQTLIKHKHKKRRV